MLTKEEEILLKHLDEQEFSNLANDGVLHLICDAMIDYKKNHSNNNEVLGSVMLNDPEKGTINILHEAERHIHPEQEKALEKITNEDLAKMAEDYKNKD